MQLRLYEWMMLPGSLCGFSLYHLLHVVILNRQCKINSLLSTGSCFQFGWETYSSRSLSLTYFACLTSECIVTVFLLFLFVVLEVVLLIWCSSHRVGVVHSVRLLSYRRCAFVNYTKQENCDEAIRRFQVSSTWEISKKWKQILLLLVQPV